MPNTITKQRKVINYLSKKGRSLSSAQARSMFGVRNLRATISDIRSFVGRYGNWSIEATDGRYTMRDLHPGKRMYRFTTNGRRIKKA